MILTGLDLVGRADLLEVSISEYLAIARRDPLIVGEAALATPASRRLVRTCHAEGWQPVDLSQIVCRGFSDELHCILTRTIATLPLTAQRHATKVLWVAIGGGRHAGWMATVPGGATHVIALDGTAPADLMPSLIVHELAHAIHTDINPAPPTKRLPASEYVALHLAVETMRGGDVETTVRSLYRDEVLANDTAALWRYPSSVLCPDGVRLRWLREDVLAARGRAAEIVAELEQPLAACEIDTNREGDRKL